MVDVQALVKATGRMTSCNDATCSFISSVHPLIVQIVAKRMIVSAAALCLCCWRHPMDICGVAQAESVHEVVECEWQILQSLKFLI